MRTAREWAHELFAATGRFVCPDQHDSECDALTAAIKARDRVHEAIELVSREIAARWEANAVEIQRERDTLRAALTEARKALKKFGEEARRPWKNDLHMNRGTCPCSGCRIKRAYAAALDRITALEASQEGTTK